MEADLKTLDYEFPFNILPRTSNIQSLRVCEDSPTFLREKWFRILYGIATRLACLAMLFLCTGDRPTFLGTPAAFSPDMHFGVPAGRHKLVTQDQRLAA